MQGKDGEVIDRLERVIALLENLFILQATQAGVGVEQQRKVLGIAKERINQVSKEVRKGGKEKFKG